MSRFEPPTDIAAVVRAALAEDIGTGDLSAESIEAARAVHAAITLREHAVICGAPYVDEVFQQLDSRIRVRWHHSDGEACEPGAVVAELDGPARPLLSGERTALNFLQTLSGTATVTQEYCRAVEGTRVRILDTRKTLPGLRQAQKYAVRCGGGTNHRIGLFDAVLLKENHIAAAGGFASAVDAARARNPSTMIEVEVETIEELRETLETSADRLMLDDFSLEDMATAVRLRDAHAGHRKELEASGGIETDSIRAIAATGVDFISVGAITKHVRAIDFSMRIAPG